MERLCPCSRCSRDLTKHFDLSLPDLVDTLLVEGLDAFRFLFERPTLLGECEFPTMSRILVILFLVPEYTLYR